MDGDFLHQIRADPPASFFAELKAKLDGQGVAPPATRRGSLRPLAILIFLGSTGVAIALMVGRGIPSRAHQLSAVPATASSQPIVPSLAPVAIQSPPPESTTNTSMSIAADIPAATSEQKTEEAETAGPTGAVGGKYEGLLLQVLMANAPGECPAALMRDELKKSCESQLPEVKDKLAKLGPFKGISFQTTRSLEGGPAEVYRVTFDHGYWTWVLNAGSDGAVLRDG